MWVNLKICENENCWEVMGWFPKIKCQFCWSEIFSTHKVFFWLVLWGSTPYHHDHRYMWVLMNYKWADHVFIRTAKWEGASNNCDNNWWYIHYMCVDDAPIVDSFVRCRISKEWNYIWLE